jgi:hypothetical protein
VKRLYVFGALVFGFVVAGFFLLQGTSFDLANFWDSIVAWFQDAGSELGLTMKLNAQQIAHHASDAGFTGDDFTVAIAIALAESGGDPSAYNPEVAAGTPEGLGSVGLWQVYLKVHPEYTAEQMRDPQLNADAAYAIFKAAGFNFTPWSTFKNGAYAKYVGKASEVLQA